MNQAKRKYLLDRIKQIENDHSAVILSASKALEKPKLTTADKLSLINLHKAKFIEPTLPDSRDSYGGPYLIDCYEYPQESRITERNKEVSKQTDALLRQLRNDAKRLRDLVLITEMELTTNNLKEFEDSKYKFDHGCIDF